MSTQANPYPLRVDKNIMDKIKYIAKENGRSTNKEIEVSLKSIIFEYEKENGKISIEN